jgi:phage tail sheath protein FI
MSYNIGLNVVEVDGVGAPAIAGAATSVAAFNILTRRGLPNTPGRVNSFAEFVERFGSYFDNGLGAYLVRGFFDNGGGAAYANRVVSASSTVASLTLVDDGPADTLRVEGGFRGSEDPGSWGLDIFVRTTRTSSVAGRRLVETAPAEVQTAAPLPATTDMVAAAFPSLMVTIDGAATATEIPFVAADFADPSNATPAEIVDVINAATDDLDASLGGGGELVLTSTGNIAMLLGGFTSLAVATNATLGFGAPASAGGTTAALGANGTTLNRVDGLEVGDGIELDDGTTSEIVKVLSINPQTRAITWTPALAAPGAYDDILLRIRNLEFDLRVYEGGPDEEDNLVETWLGLSMESDVSNYAVAVINDALAGSKFVRVVDEASGTGIGLNRPVDLATPVQFDTGGVDGVATSSEFIGDEAGHTGFHAFDTFEVQLVTCERTDPSIAEAGISYCEARGDCMYVGAIPDGSLEAGTALAYGQGLQGSKRSGALYGPWIMVSDPNGVGDNPLKSIPPIGHVMGVYARIDGTRGLWKAPAGDEARLRNVLDVTYRLTDAEHTNIVKNAGINGVRAVPRAGIIIDASRTLSTDPRWFYVNVRLLFNYLKSSLMQGLRWVRQEPNKDTLWNLVKYGSVTPFLMGLWRQGAFGTGSPSEVFTVICDASNNPPDQIQLGFLNVEVYIYPTNPAETIVIKVGQQPAGGTVSEA